MRLFYASLVLAVILFGTISCSMTKVKETTIQDGKKVSFDYTLTVDGQVVDSSEQRGPLTYTQGQGQIIPGLANELVGLKVGDEKKVVVAPENAYGIINQNAFQEVDKSSLPENVEVEVGTILQVQNEQGQSFPVKVSEVKDNTVVLDFNHPLAGKTLNFDVKIVSIE